MQKMALLASHRVILQSQDGGGGGDTCIMHDAHLTDSRLDAEDGLVGIAQNDSTGSGGEHALRMMLALHLVMLLQDTCIMHDAHLADSGLDTEDGLVGITQPRSLK